MELREKIEPCSSHEGFCTQQLHRCGQKCVCNISDQALAYATHLGEGVEGEQRISVVFSCTQKRDFVLEQLQTAAWASPAPRRHHLEQ